VGGNLWRTTGDINDRWQTMTRLGFEPQPGREKYAGPGHWNDPDMLEVGNGGMTVAEYRAHFSFWALLASPLMAGNDVRSMAPDIKDILTNSEVIAVNQDKLGREGRRVVKNGDLEVWAKPLSDGSRAVILFNRGTSESDVSVSWEQIGYPNHLPAKVRDLWAHKDLGSFSGTYSAKVGSHSVVMVKIAP
jgi:alpha-galactosidase